MKQYPDGSGYPFAEAAEPPAIPEYARMACIADDYDELTNPVLNPHPMGRAEALGFLERRSGEYRPAKESARYDRVLLDEFSRIVKPFEEGERVDLFMGGKRSRRYYCGFALAYGQAGDRLPQVCVLKNVVAGESYAFGRVAFDLVGMRVLLLDEEGKLGAAIERGRMNERDEKGGYRVKNPKIREMLLNLPELACLDDVKDAWSPEEYSDPAFDAVKPSK
jgi:hypothetical protein